MRVSSYSRAKESPTDGRGSLFGPDHGHFKRVPPLPDAYRDRVSLLYPLDRLTRSPQAASYPNLPDLIVAFEGSYASIDGILHAPSAMNPRLRRATWSGRWSALRLVPMFVYRPVPSIPPKIADPVSDRPSRNVPLRQG